MRGSPPGNGAEEAGGAPPRAPRASRPPHGRRRAAPLLAALLALSSGCGAGVSAARSAPEKSPSLHLSRGRTDRVERLPGTNCRARVLRDERGVYSARLLRPCPLGDLSLPARALLDFDRGGALSA